MKIDQTLCGLLLLDFLVFSAFSLPLPFFPQLAKTKGLSEGMIGFIFGCFNLGSFLSSLIYGKMMFFFKKKQLLQINLVLCSLGTISFGLLDLIENIKVYAIVGCISRILTGFVSGGIVTIIFGYLPTLYPNEVPQKQAYFEIAFSCATLGGSLLGGLLYKFANFQLPFIIIGCSYLILGYPIVNNLPDIEQIQDQNQQLKEQSIEPQTNNTDLHSYKRNTSQLTFSLFIMNPRFICTILIVMIQVMIQSFTYSTLQLKVNSFQDGEYYVLPAFIVTSVVYGLFCVVFSKTLSKSVDQRYYIAIGTFIMIMCLVLVGPISCLGIHNDIRLFFIGITFEYLFAGLGVFAILNEICMIGVNIDDQIDSTQANDMCSGLFVSAVSIGGFSGPILAGQLIQHYSFETSFTIFFSFSILIFIMYMTIGQGYELFIGINPIIKPKQYDYIEMV